MTRAEAHMATLDLEGGVLTVTPSNAASRVALLGQAGAGGQDALVLRTADIDSVQAKSAGALTNGRLTIVATGGGKYLVHFRKKHTAGVDEVLAGLRADGVTIL